MLKERQVIYNQQQITLLKSKKFCIQAIIVSILMNWLFFLSSLNNLGYRPSCFDGKYCINNICNDLNKFKFEDGFFYLKEHLNILKNYYSFVISKHIIIWKIF